MRKLQARDLLEFREALRERARRRAIRPRVIRPPDAVGIAYARDLVRLRRAWETEVKEILKPTLIALETQKSERFDVLPTRLEQELQRLRERVDAFLEEHGLSGMLDDTVLRTNRWATQELSASLGIDITSPTTGLGPLIQRFREDNILLIRRNINGSLDDLATLLDERIGMRAESIMGEIEEQFGVSSTRAALLAKDQTLKLNSKVNQQKQLEVGVSKYVWITSRDERVRGRPDGKWPVPKNGGGNHFALEGETFSWLEPPITNTRTKARNHPGEDILCRCTATPDLSDILG